MSDYRDIRAQRQAALTDEERQTYEQAYRAACTSEGGHRAPGETERPHHRRLGRRPRRVKSN